MLNPKREQFAKMVALVASYSGVPEAIILGKNRQKPIVEARWFAMFLCRRLCQGSYPEIANHFGCDHTAVMHAVRKTENSPLARKMKQKGAL